MKQTGMQDSGAGQAGSSSRHRVVRLAAAAGSLSHVSNGAVVRPCYLWRRRDAHAARLYHERGCPCGGLLSQQAQEQRSQGCWQSADTALQHDWWR